MKNATLLTPIHPIVNKIVPIAPIVYVTVEVTKLAVRTLYDRICDKVGK
jgi:hypothetical protein